METKTAIQTRRSIRVFTQKPVAPALITDLVATAQRAPSWANSQPWSVYVATGKHLDQIRQAFMQRAEANQTQEADFGMAHRDTFSAAAQANMGAFGQQMQATLAQAATKANQEPLYNAPAVVYLVLDKKVSPWAIYDLGAFGQTLMLAAIDQGVQSMPAYSLVQNPDVLHEILGIPADQNVAMGIALGYADAQAPINQLHTKRAPLDQVLHLKN